MGSQHMQQAISILPADQRMEYLSDYMRWKGAVLCQSLEDIGDSGLIICPTPFTRDGIHVNTTLSPALVWEDLLGMLNSSHTLV